MDSFSLSLPDIAPIGHKPILESDSSEVELVTPPSKFKKDRPTLISSASENGDGYRPRPLSAWNHESLSDSFGSPEIGRAQKDFSFKGGSIASSIDNRENRSPNGFINSSKGSNHKALPNEQNEQIKSESKVQDKYYNIPPEYQDLVGASRVPKGEGMKSAFQHDSSDSSDSAVRRRVKNERKSHKSRGLGLGFGTTLDEFSGMESVIESGATGGRARPQYKTPASLPKDPDLGVLMSTYMKLLGSKKADIADLQSKLKSTNTRMGYLEELVRNKDERIQQLDKQSEEKDQRIRQLEQRLDERDKQMKELESQMEINNKQINDMKIQGVRDSPVEGDQNDVKNVQGVQGVQVVKDAEDVPSVQNVQNGVQDIHEPETPDVNKNASEKLINLILNAVQSRVKSGGTVSQESDMTQRSDPCACTKLNSNERSDGDDMQRPRIPMEDAYSLVFKQLQDVHEDMRSRSKKLQDELDSIPAGEHLQRRQRLLAQKFSLEEETTQWGKTISALLDLSAAIGNLERSPLYKARKYPTRNWGL